MYSIINEIVHDPYVYIIISDTLTIAIEARRHAIKFYPR